MEIRGKARMLELTIYGLMGLAAVLVIAFFFAFGDEFAPARKTSSFDLVSNAHSDGSQMIESRTGSLRPRSTVGKQHETAPASLLQTASVAETGPGAI